MLPSNLHWIKSNIDGAARGSRSFVVCDGIFRDLGVATRGCFDVNLGITFALHDKLIGAITSIELAYKNGWNKLSSECDSQSVILPFNSFRIVPRQLEIEVRFIHSQRKGFRYAPFT